MRRRDVLGATALLSGCASVSAPDAGHPLIIAHRGASGERPEHTMAAYRLAIVQGADMIEPDLVMTKDGVLVCRHENEISGTTDVAARPEFSARYASKTIDGGEIEGWFVEDFTLAELQMLRCRERLPELRPQNVAYDGREEIPTFAEVLALAARAGVGVCPELKHPNYLRTQGLDPVPALLGAIHAGGGQRVADRMLIQCFEMEPLMQFASISSLNLKTLQLVAAESGPWDRRDLSVADMISDAGLARIASYASFIGVDKSLIVPRDAQNRAAAPSDLIARAHRASLKVVAWTFRAENHFLPLELRRGDDPATLGDLDAELRPFFGLGVDGVFCDFPGIAVGAR